MYSNAHEYEVKVELAWRDYISALEDLTMPYNKVVKLRELYENILNDCPCKCEVCST